MKLLWLQRRGATDHRLAATASLFSEMMIFPRFWQHFRWVFEARAAGLHLRALIARQNPIVQALFGEKRPKARFDCKTNDF